MRRRSFIGGMTLGAIAGWGQPGKDARAASKVKAGDIPKRSFGKTGEKLTVIGQAGGRFPLIPEEDAKAIVLRAYELGINYFDNAHSYWNGHSEEVYGMVLPPFRKEVFITTKSTKRSRKEAAAELDLSLKRLRTDYVDLWQIHAVGEMEEVRQTSVPAVPWKPLKPPRRRGSAVISALPDTATPTFTWRCSKPMTTTTRS